jgi:hypothetical protein
MAFSGIGWCWQKKNTYATFKARDMNDIASASRVILGSHGEIGKIIPLAPYPGFARLFASDDRPTPQSALP